MKPNQKWHVCNLNLFLLCQEQWFIFISAVYLILEPTSNTHKKLSNLRIWKASSCVTTKSNSCWCSKESHCRWICCYASAGLFCFGLESSKGCLQEARNVYTNTTLTGRLWKHLLRCCTEEKKSKRMRQFTYKQTSQQFNTIGLLQLLNMSIHSHWISSCQDNMRPNAIQVWLCIN